MPVRILPEDENLARLIAFGIVKTLELDAGIEMFEGEWEAFTDLDSAWMKSCIASLKEGHSIYLDRMRSKEVDPETSTPRPYHHKIIDPAIDRDSASYESEVLDDLLSDDVEDPEDALFEEADEEADNVTTAASKLKMKQTGLQYMAEQILPKGLKNAVGTWLLKKLFDALVTKKLIPKKMKTWLHKPFVPNTKGPILASVMGSDIEAGSDGIPYIISDVFSGPNRTARRIAREVIAGNANPENTEHAQAILSWVESTRRIPNRVLAGLIAERTADILENVSNVAGKMQVLASVASSVTLAKGPTESRDSVRPKGITDKAQKIWSEVLDTHATEIQGAATVPQQWSVAIAFLVTTAAAQGVEAFTVEGSGWRQAERTQRAVKRRFVRLENMAEHEIDVGLRSAVGIRRAEAAVVESGTVEKTENGYTLKTTSIVSVGMSQARIAAMKDKLRGRKAWLDTFLKTDVQPTFSVDLKNFPGASVTGTLHVLPDRQSVEAFMHLNKETAVQLLRCAGIYEEMEDEDDFIEALQGVADRWAETGALF